MRRPTRLPYRGRLIRLGEVSKARRSAAAPGYWRQHVHKESARNTGSPKAWAAMPNRTPARDRPGALGWAARPRPAWHRRSCDRACMGRAVECARQHFALAGLPDRAFCQFAIIQAGCAFGPALQKDLAVDAVSHERSPSVATIRANPPYSDGLINFHLWGVVMAITICRSQAPGLPKKSFFVTAGTSQRPPLR